MKVDNVELKVSRVEIIKRVFNDKGQVTNEEIQFFYPEGGGNIIQGFKKK